MFLIGHEMKDCIGVARELSGTNDEVAPAFAAEVEFIFVRLNILREYLEKELEMPNLPFRYDFERAVDDWVFMCFFVGNDFLPHLPSLEIREGAIDRLVNLYKKTVYKTGVSRFEYCMYCIPYVMQVNPSHPPVCICFHYLIKYLVIYSNKNGTVKYIRMDHQYFN